MITIAIPHHNAVRFIGTILMSLEKLTVNDYSVIICDNSMSRDELQKFAKNPRVNLMFIKESGHGGIGHGEALNALVERIDTPYGVFLESDAIFLKKGWDEIMIKELKGKTKIIGSPRPENPIQPTDFPSVFATMFDVKTFKSLGIDMKPKDIYKGQDTGWEMREKFLKAGYKGKTFETKVTRTFKEGPFKDVICMECYFNDELIASHFGRGSTLGMAKYCKRWRIPVIKTIVRKIKGYYERDKWLEICRRIIEKEARI